MPPKLRKTSTRTASSQSQSSRSGSSRAPTIESSGSRNPSSSTRCARTRARGSPSLQLPSVTDFYGMMDTETVSTMYAQSIVSLLDSGAEGLFPFDHPMASTALAPSVTNDTNDTTMFPITRNESHFVVKPPPKSLIRGLELTSSGSPMLRTLSEHDDASFQIEQEFSNASGRGAVSSRFAMPLQTSLDSSTTFHPHPQRNAISGSVRPIAVKPSPAPHPPPLSSNHSHFTMSSSMTTSTSTSMGPPTQSDGLIPTLSTLPTTKRKTRGRNPTPTNIMIPTPDGGRISLDTAVDALIDATCPSLIGHGYGDGEGGEGSEGEESDDSDTGTMKRSKRSKETTNTTNTTTTTATTTTGSPVESLKDKRLKNATSARRSRLRKQLRLQTMQECLGQLEKKIEELTRRNKELEMEVAVLRKKYGE